MRKPPVGARINLAHPLGRDCVVCVPFNDGAGAPSILTGITPTGVPLVGSSVRQERLTLISAPSWGSNHEGPCGVLDTSTQGWRFDNDLWLPTLACTMCIIRRKRAAVNLGSSVGPGGDSNTYAFNVLLPFGDGSIYWDFGGWAGANRLSVGGLSFAITNIDRWVFTAGPKGSAIYQNGKKVASQGTAITRTTADLPFKLETVDTADWGYFAIHNTQWSEDQAQWWSVEPYAGLYVPTVRRYLFVGSSSTVVLPPKKGGKKGSGVGGKDLYGPTLTVPWDSVNTFGSG